MSDRQPGLHRGYDAVVVGEVVQASSELDGQAVLLRGGQPGDDVGQWGAATSWRSSSGADGNRAAKPAA